MLKVIFMSEIILMSEGHFNVGGSFLCRKFIFMSEGHFFVGGSF